MAMAVTRKRSRRAISRLQRRRVAAIQNQRKGCHQWKANAFQNTIGSFKRDDTRWRSDPAKRPEESPWNVRGIHQTAVITAAGQSRRSFRRAEADSRSRAVATDASDANPSFFVSAA